MISNKLSKETTKDEIYTAIRFKHTECFLPQTNIAYVILSIMYMEELKKQRKNTSTDCFQDNYFV